MKPRRNRPTCKDCPELSATLFVDADGTLLNMYASNRPPGTVEGIRRTRYKPAAETWLGYYRFFGEDPPGPLGW